jgi:glutathione synthase/RimK-type ligase-like ATP-grasp enzyme
MKVAILHQKLEYAEQQLSTLFQQRGHEISLIDIRQLEGVAFRQFDIVLNRVYASVANRCFEDTIAAIDLLEKLEAAGIRCINSLSSSRADYDKYIQYQQMKNHGVATPETVSVHSQAEFQLQREAIGQLGFPLVLKRRTGGRAEGIFKINSNAELLACLETVFKQQGYTGGYIIQQFHQSLGPHDYRIAIFDGDYSYSYARSLVATASGEQPWIGSGDLGSVFSPYQPTEAEIQLAIKASCAMGAIINEVDLLVTDNGPLVIENNLTPNFRPKKQHYLEAMFNFILRYNSP